MSEEREMSYTIFRTKTLQGTAFIAFLLMSSCSSEDNVSGPPSEEISIVLTSANSVETSQWQFISVRTELDGGIVWERKCVPLTSSIIPTVIEAPGDNTVYRVVVDIFSGVDVCEPNGGGILLARGTRIIDPITTPGITTQVISIPVSPAGVFSSTFDYSNGTITSNQDQRFGASAIQLSNGLILVTGGGALKSALETYKTDTADVWQKAENLTNLNGTMELYDPETGLWTMLSTGISDGNAPLSEQERGNARRLPRPRIFHHTLYLPERNQVAITGGYEETAGGDIVPSSSVVLIDLETMTPLPGDSSGDAIVARALGTANTIETSQGTLLFLAGGLGEEASNTYEVLLPGPLGTTGQDHILGFGSLPRPRWNHTATKLISRANIPQIYLVGGDHPDGLNKLIDVFDIDKKRFYEAPGNADAVTGLQGPGRVGHSTIFVPSLNALYVIGGFTTAERTAQTNRIEVLDADTGAHLTDETTGFNLINKRANQAALLMNETDVLITGGVTLTDQGFQFMSSADELITDGGSIPESNDAGAISVLSVNGMLTRRAGHSMVALKNNQILSFGGYRLNGEGIPEVLLTTPLNSNSEVYTPISGSD